MLYTNSWIELHAVADEAFICTLKHTYVRMYHVHMYIVVVRKNFAKYPGKSCHIPSLDFDYSVLPNKELDVEFSHKCQPRSTHSTLATTALAPFIIKPAQHRLPWHLQHGSHHEAFWSNMLTKPLTAY